MKRLLGLALLLAACGRGGEGTDRRRERDGGAVEVVQPADARPPGLEPFGFDGLAGWAPPKLLGLEQERITTALPGKLLDARYLGGGTEVHLNISLVDDAGSARAFYQDEYRPARARGFEAWVRHHELDDGRRFAEACTVIQERVGLCASVWPGKGGEALPYLEAVDLPALARWADPRSPEEIRDSEIIRKTLLGAATEHNEVRRVSWPTWYKYRRYKLINYTQPHMPGCMVAIGPADEVLVLAGEGDRVLVDDPIGNFNRISSAEEISLDDYWAKHYFRMFVGSYFASFQADALEPQSIEPQPRPDGAGWDFRFTYRKVAYSASLSRAGRVELRRSGKPR